MTAGWFRTALKSARRWQPRTFLQAWLSAAALPLVVLIVGVGLRLIFHSWPQSDGPWGAIAMVVYIAMRGSAQSRALRARRDAARRGLAQSEPLARLRTDG